MAIDNMIHVQLQRAISGATKTDGPLQLPSSSTIGNLRQQLRHDAGEEPYSQDEPNAWVALHLLIGKDTLEDNVTLASLAGPDHRLHLMITNCAPKLEGCHLLCDYFDAGVVGPVDSLPQRLVEHWLFLEGDMVARLAHENEEDASDPEAGLGVQGMTIFQWRCCMERDGDRYMDVIDLEARKVVIGSGNAPMRLRFKEDGSMRGVSKALGMPYGPCAFECEMLKLSETRLLHPEGWFPSGCISLSAYALTLTCELSLWVAEAPWVEELIGTSATSVLRSAAPVSRSDHCHGAVVRAVLEGAPNSTKVIEAAKAIAQALQHYVSHQLLPTLKDLWQKGRFETMDAYVKEPNKQLSVISAFIRILREAAEIPSTRSSVADSRPDVVLLVEAFEECRNCFDQMKKFCAFQEAQLKRTPIAIDDTPSHVHDVLNFFDLAAILIGLLADPNARLPIFCGIHAIWGSGKTILINFMKELLRKRNVVCVDAAQRLAKLPAEARGCCREGWCSRVIDAAARLGHRCGHFACCCRGASAGSLARDTAPSGDDVGLASTNANANATAPADGIAVSPDDEVTAMPRCWCCNWLLRRHRVTTAPTLSPSASGFSAPQDEELGNRSRRSSPAKEPDTAAAGASAHGRSSTENVGSTRLASRKCRGSCCGKGEDEAEKAAPPRPRLGDLPAHGSDKDDAAYHIIADFDAFRYADTDILWTGLCSCLQHAADEEFGEWYQFAVTACSHWLYRIVFRASLAFSLIIALLALIETSFLHTAMNVPINACIPPLYRDNVTSRLAVSNLGADFHDVVPDLGGCSGSGAKLWLPSKAAHLRVVGAKPEDFHDVFLGEGIETYPTKKPNSTSFNVSTMRGSLQIEIRYYASKDKISVYSGKARGEIVKISDAFGAYGRITRIQVCTETGQKGTRARCLNPARLAEDKRFLWLPSWLWRAMIFRGTIGQLVRVIFAAVPLSLLTAGLAVLWEKRQEVLRRLPSIAAEYSKEGRHDLVDKVMEQIKKLDDFVQHRKDWLRVLAGGGPPTGGGQVRWAIFVDNLDRCKPKVVVEVLQTMLNLSQALPNCFLVLAIDSHRIYEQIETYFATADGKGLSGRGFLNKFQSLVVSLPPPTAAGMEQLVRSRMSASAAATCDAARQGAPASRPQGASGGPPAAREPQTARSSLVGTTTTHQDILLRQRVMGHGIEMTDMNPTGSTHVGGATMDRLELGLPEEELKHWAALSGFLKRNPRHLVLLLNTYSIARQLVAATHLIDGSLLRMLVVLGRWPMRSGLVLLHAELEPDQGASIADMYKAKRKDLVKLIQQDSSRMQRLMRDDDAEEEFLHMLNIKPVITMATVTKLHAGLINRDWYYQMELMKMIITTQKNQEGVD